MSSDTDGEPAADLAWELAVARDELSRTWLHEVDRPEVRPGQALLRVDRVALTANTVTYAVAGDAFGYWEFFPTEPGWGVVPVWGFADVIESAAERVAVGDRVYGFLPSAGQLHVEPGRVDARALRDVSPHRADLPSPYNTYVRTTGDPSYEPDREDLQALYRPLFYTSFMLADWLVDADFAGAEVVVLSSASSKTAYGTAFELRGRDRRVVGLTSAGHAAFTDGLGCYDDVLTYGTVTELPTDVGTVYVDVAGNPQLAEQVRTHLGDALCHHVAVGITHQGDDPGATPSATGGELFFAPDHMRTRIADWGREELDRRYAEAWRRFVPVVESWVDVQVDHGPEALEEVWRRVQAGRADPRTGHIISL